MGKVKASVIDDSIAMAYLMNLATRAAADESFEAMKQGKLNAGATARIESVEEEGPNLVFFFTLSDGVHPDLQTAITISAMVNHAETSDQPRFGMQDVDVTRMLLPQVTRVIDLFAEKKRMSTQD